MNLKKLERYIRVNLLGPDPRLMKKEFTWPRSHKVEKHWSRHRRKKIYWTAGYSIQWCNIFER